MRKSGAIFCLSFKHSKSNAYNAIISNIETKHEKDIDEIMKKREEKQAEEEKKLKEKEEEEE